MTYSDACTDRFYFDTGGRIVSAGKRAVCLQVYSIGAGVYSLRSAALTIGSSSLSPSTVFSINSFGQITNSFLDQTVANQQLCLEDNTTTQSVPSFIRCDGTSSFWAETAWFFDGGDCRFNQLLATCPHCERLWDFILSSLKILKLATSLDFKAQSRRTCTRPCSGIMCSQTMLIWAPKQIPELRSRCLMPKPKLARQHLAVAY